jgi:hypothetical protein
MTPEAFARVGWIDALAERLARIPAVTAGESGRDAAADANRGAR